MCVCGGGGGGGGKRREERKKGKGDDAKVIQKWVILCLTCSSAAD